MSFKLQLYGKKLQFCGKTVAECLGKCRAPICDWWANCGGMVGRWLEKFPSDVVIGGAVWKGEGKG